MGDSYKEIMVKQKQTPFDRVGKVLMIFGIILLVLAGFVINPIMLLFAVGGIFAFSYFSAGFNREYEYLYVNGDLDVDVIKNRQRRKKQGSYALNQLQMAAPEGSHDLDSYLASGKVVIKDFCSHVEGDKVTCLVYDQEDHRVMIKVNLDDEVLTDMKRRDPRKFSRDLGII